MWPKPERIFSPREKRIRNNLASLRWQRRNRPKCRAQAKARWQRDKVRLLAINAAWCKANRGRRNATCRRGTKDLRPYYLRMLLRNAGITNPTPEDYERKRLEVLACRRKRAVLKSHQVLGILQSCASLTKKLPASSPR